VGRSALAVLRVLGLSLGLRHHTAGRSILGGVGNGLDITMFELRKLGEWILLCLYTRFLLEACLSKEAFLGALGTIRYDHTRKDIDHAVRQGGEKAEILNLHYGCGTSWQNKLIWVLLVTCRAWRRLETSDSNQHGGG